MQAGNDHHDRRLTQNEAAARAALELRGRTITDAEWAAERAKLLEFVGILRVWDQETSAPRRGNVEVLCQPEP